MDMFYKYDNNIDNYINKYAKDNKFYVKNPTIVFDALGNKVGVAAKINSNFNLCFKLFGNLTEDVLNNIIETSRIQLIVTDYWHKCVLEKYMLSKNCVSLDGIINIQINQQDFNLLKTESYYLTLNLIFNDDSSYSLYSKNNEVLIVVQ